MWSYALLLTPYLVIASSATLGISILAIFLSQSGRQPQAAGFGSPAI